MRKDFDLTISERELAALAPALVDTLREFVTYGLCRQANTVERKMLSEKFADLAHGAMQQFPTLKLNHCGAKTIVEPAERQHDEHGGGDHRPTPSITDPM
jgi:hypothetical protein